MKIDGSVMISINCILENNLPTTIVGNQWYITVKNANDTVGKLWVPNSNGRPVCLVDTPITDAKIASLENQINVLNGNMRRFGIETVPAQNGGYANDIKETGIRFVFNVAHIPSGYSYGMLETFNLEASGFSPSNKGVVIQRFTDWYSGYVFTRAYRQESWSEWNCPDAKIEALQEQITAISNMLMETANLEQE